MAPRSVTFGIAAALAAGVVAAPLAAGAAAPTTKPTHLKSTTIQLKAAKATVAPKHKTSLTAVLKSAGKPVAGEELWLQKRDSSTQKFSTPTDIGTTDGNGRVTVPVVPGNHKGVKEQYRVVFQGDTTHKGSHSAVITVTVVAAG